MLEIVESFYHETYIVKKNKVVIGNFTPSTGYGSELHFEVNGGILTSNDLKRISESLGQLNYERRKV